MPSYNGLLNWYVPWQQQSACGSTTSWAMCWLWLLKYSCVAWPMYKQGPKALSSMFGPKSVYTVNDDGEYKWKQSLGSSNLKSFGLVGGSAATMRRSTFIRWTRPKFTYDLRTILTQFLVLRQSYDNWQIHRTFTTILRPIFRQHLTITFGCLKTTGPHWDSQIGLLS